MSDSLFGHVLNINSLLFISLVYVSEGSSNLSSVRVHLINSLVKSVKVLVLLLSKAIEPHVFVLLVVRDDVCVPVSQILLPQFH